MTLGCLFFVCNGYISSPLLESPLALPHRLRPQLLKQLYILLYIFTPLCPFCFFCRSVSLPAALCLSLSLSRELTLFPTAALLASFINRLFLFRRSPPPSPACRQFRGPYVMFFSPRLFPLSCPLFSGISSPPHSCFCLDAASVFLFLLQHTSRSEYASLPPVLLRTPPRGHAHAVVR